MSSKATAKLWLALLLLLRMLPGHWEHLGTGVSVTSYVTVTTSVRLISASSLIAAISHFKSLRALGQRQLGQVLLSSYKNTFPKVWISDWCLQSLTGYVRLSKLQHRTLCLPLKLLLILVLAALSVRLHSSVIRRHSGNKLKGSSLLFLQRP